jgi:hypothetical protein
MSDRAQVVWSFSITKQKEINMANYALLTGVDYEGTENELYGCANDIKNMAAVLKQNNFASENIRMMSDDASVPNAIYPNKKNILAELKALIAKAKTGDTIFWHYSGHGTYDRDSRLNSDEIDGKDEAICALDANIKDDELYEIIKTVKKDVKFFAIMDCCHSGSMFDLFNNLDSQKSKRGNNPAHGYTVMLSGCQDSQTSADADVDNDGSNEGALTSSFFNQVNKKGFWSVVDTLFSNSLSKMKTLRNDMYTWLQKEGFSQKPNISFEGTLPSVLTAFNKGGYSLRRTSNRSAENYEEVAVKREYKPTRARA